MEISENLEGFAFKIEPIWHTYVFELKKNLKKFLIFCIVIGSIGFSFGFLLELIPQQNLPPTQADYFQSALGFIVWIIYFSVSFFFAGIICSEFSEKTGYIIFPKINKYKLITGKYFSNLTYTLGLLVIYYFVMGILGILYYGFPLDSKLFLSLGIALLFTVACSSFVTFFSSFFKNVSMTIVSCILILLIGFSIADQIVVLNNPDIEPLYSYDFLSRLIVYVLEQDFPSTVSERYEDMEFENFIIRIWITPSIEMGITIMTIYSVLFLGLAMIIFTRKQL
ncbi:MAG: hypothetical protein EU544_04060 [Promethearchaeota archaeon]|nr:MAG: hypothetical protein EU544_04060 [Candidatus Lokiarchaeota archaeon]